MTIEEAKRELYTELKEKFPEVIGAAIRERKGEEVIVIILLAPKRKMRPKLPASYEGFKVVTEWQSRARPK